MVIGWVQIVHSRWREGGARPEQGMDKVSVRRPWGSGSPGDFGAVLVVLTPIVPDHHPSLRERVQLFPVQAFIPKPTVEALKEAVLPGTPRFDVQGLHPVLLQPPLHEGGDELRSIVAPQIRRRPVLLDGPLQPFQDVLRLQGPVCSQHVAFAGVLIKDRQDPQGSAPNRRVREKVPRPHMSAVERLRQ